MANHHEGMFRQRFWISLLLSIPVLVFSPTLQDWLNFEAPQFPGSQWITPVFALIVFAYGGTPFLRMALPEVKQRRPGMMTLISLAILVALVYSMATLFMESSSGFFWELVTLIDVMLLGHWIEMRSVRQASQSLDELAKLLPDTAERIDDNGEIEEVKVDELAENDLVLVRPGASIPADGVIEEGHSQINEAMITGESKPADKAEGDEVIAGTINGDSSLRVRIKATGDDTALAGIMRLVKDAQESKSNTQLLADRAAGWLFYAALIVAVITVIAWTVATGFNADVVKRAATVLVIACPHALGLAIPLVIAISTSMAASNGILVRERLALEQSRINDAPALARADVGIAIGSGTDVAVESPASSWSKTIRFTWSVSSGSASSTTARRCRIWCGLRATTWSPCRWLQASWLPWASCYRRP